MSEMIEATPSVKIIPPEMVTRFLDDGEIEIKCHYMLRAGEEVSYDNKRWMVLMSMTDGRAWLRPKTDT